LRISHPLLSTPSVGLNRKSSTELVVQVNPDFASVISGLDIAQKIDYEKWEIDVEIWLADPATKQVWDSENVYKRIVQDMIQFLEVNLKNNS
jgi:hypothetical protein